VLDRGEDQRCRHSVTIVVIPLVTIDTLHTSTFIVTPLTEDNFTSVARDPGSNYS
jgi:hypothetical protein